ncbi:hypothetical protein ACLOJK_027752 [Asimina triloba]
MSNDAPATLTSLTNANERVDRVFFYDYFFFIPPFLSSLFRICHRRLLSTSSPTTIRRHFSTDDDVDKEGKSEEQFTIFCYGESLSAQKGGDAGRDLSGARKEKHGMAALKCLDILTDLNGLRPSSSYFSFLCQSLTPPKGKLQKCGRMPAPVRTEQPFCLPSKILNDDGVIDVIEITSFSEINNEGDKISIVSLDFILPDVLLESVLGYLPIVSIVRARSVCKRWKEAVKSRRFLWNSSFLVQKSWYFMFTGGVDPGVCFMGGFSRRLDCSYEVFLRASYFEFSHWDVFQEWGFGKSLVSWTVMISGYTQNGQPGQALNLLLTLRTEENFDLDSVTLNSLIMAYSKCGDAMVAHGVFREMPCPNIISWNTIIRGYGIYGSGEVVIILFCQMVKSGNEPDAVNYLSLLHACAHSGLVDDGLSMFHFMMNERKIEPREEHYGCLVDMLVRAGRFEDANEFIDEVKADSNVWRALLGGCWINDTARSAGLLADRLFQLDQKDSSHIVLLSNLVCVIVAITLQSHLE